MPSYKCSSCHREGMSGPSGQSSRCPHCGRIGPAVPVPPALVGGLDLGQVQDYSALTVAEQTREAGLTHYDVRHLHRWPLGTSYTAIVADVKELTGKLPPGMPLAVDGTGVGRAVVDLFRQAGTQASIRPFLITGGQAVSQDKDGYRHVARVQLCSVMFALGQGSRRLHFAQGLPLARAVQQELRTFTAKITLAGNETFEAWRERDHDDLVLAVALACWLGENTFLGAWDPTPPLAARSVFESAPDGVFGGAGGGSGGEPWAF